MIKKRGGGREADLQEDWSKMTRKRGGVAKENYRESEASAAPSSRPPLGIFILPYELSSHSCRRQL